MTLRVYRAKRTFAVNEGGTIDVVDAEDVEISPREIEHGRCLMSFNPVALPPCNCKMHTKAREKGAAPE
jgi:hypothetical protein